MNRNLLLLALCQGLFLTNNVTFIAINGLVGLALAPLGWMATLPVTGDVVGAAAGTAFAAQVGGVGSIASRLVEDVTAAVVDGVVAGVTGVVDTTTTAGKAIASYTSDGIKTLGKVVDFFV